MAIRKTTHILKNTQTNNKPLPTSGIEMGEPLVNLFNGILYFSGTSGGNFTPSDNNSTYFEVGSNINNLVVRNQITSYSGVTNLTGKFLSGSSNGFVLADISSIAGIDSYVTGATWSPNTLTIELNNGKPNVPVTIDSFNNLNLYGTTNVNGDLVVTGTTGLQDVTTTNINTSNLYVSNTITASTGNFSNLSVTGTEIVNNLTITGTGLYNNTATLSNEIVNYGLLTSFTQTNDVYVTGNTLTSSTNDTPTQSAELTYHGIPLGGPHFITTQDTFTTGGTYNNSNKLITFVKNDSTNYTVDLSTIDTNDTYVTGGTTSGSSDSTPNTTISLEYNQDIPNGTYSLPYEDTYITGGTYNGGTLNLKRNDGINVQITGLTSTDTYVTGFTYNPSNNSLVISQNQGEPDLTQYITSFSGISIGNLTSGQVVYAGTSGQLKTDGTGEFAYNDSTNTLTIGTTSGKLVVNNGLLDGPSTFGQGGLVVGSNGSVTSPGVGDLTVHGNFIVFGTGTTIATNELYIEDPQITLNYNPTGDTSITSVSSGIRIQNGAGLLSGVTSGDTYFTIAQLSTLTGLTGTQVPDVSEYTGTSGYNNRGWLTQLNDIVIRNTNFNNGAPNGVRVLTEFDILDGGQW